MTRTIDFRYYVVRNGADFSELQAVAGSEPKITMDDSGSIKTKLSGTFLVPGEDVNWLNDEICPVMVLDGAEYRLGLFAPSKVSESESVTSKSVQIDALDRCWLVQDHRTENLLYFQAGTNYLDAVGSLLAASGIVAVSRIPTTATLQEDREDWDVGTSYLDIINQLLREINYKELYFDGEGTAILEPNVTATAANVKHILDETKVESLILPGISKTSDFHSTPNVFICVCSNADKDSGMVAVAENTNPQSPLSIARRGRRISKVVMVDNIASQAALDMYANRMVTESLMTGEVLTIQTCLLPGYGVGDVAALSYGELQTLCIDHRWTMSLKIGGTMQHTLERVVMNLE